MNHRWIATAGAVLCLACASAQAQPAGPTDAAAPADGTPSATTGTAPNGVSARPLPPPARKARPEPADKVSARRAAAPASAAASAPADDVPPSPDAAGRSVSAAAAEQKARRQFDLLDANGDGALTRGEVQLFPRLRDAFDQADANKDGRVSFEEIRAFTIRYRAERGLSTR